MGEHSELIKRYLQEVTLGLKDWCKTTRRKKDGNTMEANKFTKVLKHFF